MFGSRIAVAALLFAGGSIAFAPIHILKSYTARSQDGFSFAVDACRTASVERVASKTEQAMAKIEQLEKAIKAKADEYKGGFEERVKGSLSDAGITDGQFQGIEVDTKVEYTSEFSVDKIAGVITSAIEAYGKAAGPGGSVTAASALSNEALSAYVALVNQVAEAAKSSSKSAASFSFSMNRLAPGLFACLSATSASLEDNETFGDEAITATCFLYELIRSEDDIRKTTSFDETLIEAATLKAAALVDKDTVLKWKQLQNELVDKVATGEVKIEAFSKLNEFYEGQVEAAMKRLENEKFHDKVEPSPRRMLMAVPEPANPLKKSLTSADFERLQIINSQLSLIEDGTIKTTLNAQAVKIEKSLSVSSFGKDLLEK